STSGLPAGAPSRMTGQCLTSGSSSVARWIHDSTIDSVGRRRTRSLRPFTDRILAVRATALRRFSSLRVFTPHRDRSSAYSPPMPLTRIRSARLTHLRRSEVGIPVAFDSSARPDRVEARRRSASVVRTPALRKRVASLWGSERISSMRAIATPSLLSPNEPGTLPRWLAPLGKATGLARAELLQIGFRVHVAWRQLVRPHFPHPPEVGLEETLSALVPLQAPQPGPPRSRDRHRVPPRLTVLGKHHRDLGGGERLDDLRHHLPVDVRLVADHDEG